VACEALESRRMLSANIANSGQSSAPTHVMQPMYRVATRNGGLSPAGSAGPIGVTPAQMRSFYGIGSINFAGITGDGRGQTIAIVDAYDDPKAITDLQSFDQAFGLPDPPNFTIVNQSGGATLPSTDPVGPGIHSWELEESLDIEWSHAIAPAASIVLVECNSAGMTDLFSGVTTAAQMSGVVSVSMSFGLSEFRSERNSDSTFLTPANHSPVTFLAATGDNGSPATYPAMSPNVVAVGGTTITLNPSGGYGSETGWSGSGGGTSRYESEPSYQQSVQSTGRRTTPDVSMDADLASGVAVYDSYDAGTAAPWIQVGGTSLSTPMWAALVAIIDQGLAQVSKPSLSGPTQLLPKLYSLPNDFHDVIGGSNGGFTAVAGYDEVTGIGTPIANVLLNDVSGVAAAPPATVVGEFVFYNNSAFDGNDPAANAADDNAIATDKQALLVGGGPASFANITSYVEGINGIMVDVANLVGTPTTADFTFLVGNTADPTTWSAAPGPSALLIRAGAGTGGSTRIEITWPDGSIRNEWLQVTVAADANTGLTAPSVFYFGNLVGDAGEAAVNGQFVVTSTDEAAAESDPHGFLNPAAITDPADFNRDGKVDATDALIARYDNGAALIDLNPPAAPAAVTATAALTPSSATIDDPLDGSFKMRGKRKFTR